MNVYARYHRAFDLIQRIERIETQQELERQMADVLSDFGIDRFRNIVLAAPGQGVQPAPQFGQDDSGWAERYLDQNYARIDPFIPYVFQSTRALAWSELELAAPGKEIKTLFGAQREHGASEGFVVPVHSAGGGIGCVIFAGPQPDFSSETRPILRLLAFYFVELARDLTPAQDEPTVEVSALTRRQIECLLWVAMGKTDWEISQVLNISENTVHRHIEMAKQRLGVGTRLQAIVEAWRRGWLVV